MCIEGGSKHAVGYLVDALWRFLERKSDKEHVARLKQLLAAAGLLLVGIVLDDLFESLHGLQHFVPADVRGLRGRHRSVFAALMSLSPSCSRSPQNTKNKVETNTHKMTSL